MFEDSKRTCTAIVLLIKTHFRTQLSREKKSENSALVPSAQHWNLNISFSRSALECAMKSAMGLGFKRKRETRYEQRRLSNAIALHKAER